MAVNAKWWNDYFSMQARSIGLSEDEAERVLLPPPIREACARFEKFMTEIAATDLVRRREIRQLVDLKMKEIEENQK
jgi:hypothetical protein